MRTLDWLIIALICVAIYELDVNLMVDTYQDTQEQVSSIKFIQD